MRSLRRRIACVLFGLLSAAPAGAAVSVDPNGANVRSSGPTTVFLTFRNLRPDQRAAEGVWCGEIDASGACVPGTEFGRLPDRFDLGRISGVNVRNFTDIMNIPASVARRAYQAARRGDSAEFFYVRRFESDAGMPDEFVSVSCRMAGGGARSQLAILEVKMRFELDRPVLFVARDTPPPPLAAELHYNGTGRFKGRWEIVMPGDPQPSAEDLFTEATLPQELRGLQRRYTVLDRFDLFLPPTGHYVLPGPDPSKLPHQVDGLYQVLLRIEATDDREARSNTLEGLVFSGGVAGFPIPPLRYYVGTGADTEDIEVLATAQRLEPIVPRRRARLPAAERVNFSWVADPDATVYRLEVESDAGPVLEALVTGAVSSYTAPPWVQGRTGEVLRWRVIAIGAQGDPIAHSRWVDFQILP
jgi:hypothetical protein